MTTMNTTMEAAEAGETTGRHGRTAMRPGLYTTGHISKICGVAPRTVTKWFDSGKLEGYRIPGSQDRRVTKAALLAFLDAHGFPAEYRNRVEARTPTTAVLLVGLDADMTAEVAAMNDPTIKLAKDPFAAGLAVSDMKSGVVVVDLAMGRLDAAMLIDGIRAAESGVYVVAFGWPDDEEWANKRADGFIGRPTTMRTVIGTAKRAAVAMKGGAK